MFFIFFFIPQDHFNLLYFHRGGEVKLVFFIPYKFNSKYTEISFKIDMNLGFILDLINLIITFVCSMRDEACFWYFVDSLFSEEGIAQSSKPVSAELFRAVPLFIALDCNDDDDERGGLVTLTQNIVEVGFVMFASFISHFHIDFSI